MKQQKPNKLILNASHIQQFRAKGEIHKNFVITLLVQRSEQLDPGQEYCVPGRISSQDGGGGHWQKAILEIFIKNSKTSWNPVIF